MAKKKVFSIGNSLSDGLEQTFAAAHNYSSELRIDVIPITKIQPDPDNPRTLTVLLEDILNGLSESDPQFKKKSEEIESLRSLSNSIIDRPVVSINLSVSFAKLTLVLRSRSANEKVKKDMVFDIINKIF